MLQTPAMCVLCWAGAALSLASCDHLGRGGGSAVGQPAVCWMQSLASRHRGTAEGEKKLASEPQHCFLQMTSHSIIPNSGEDVVKTFGAKTW